MQVIVDGIKDMVSVDSDAGETLEEFLNGFKDFVVKNEKIVSSITIDGYEITPPFVDDIFEKPINDVKEVRIETIAIKELSLQTLGEVDTTVSKAIEEFKHASDIIYSQKYDESAQLIARAVQKWRFCQQALDAIITILIDLKKGINAEKLKANYKLLEEVIKQLTEALENQDFMMVKDVIDYELLDKLEEMLVLKEELKQYLQ